MTGSPAVALFLARARDVRPDLQLAPSDATLVADICRRLDGLPLAIELAAARVKLLSPEALLASSGRRDASERQRTLWGAIAWSYDLLSPDEQTLRQLLVCSPRRYQRLPRKGERWTVTWLSW